MPPLKPLQWTIATVFRRDGGPSRTIYCVMAAGARTEPLADDVLTIGVAFAGHVPKHGLQLSHHTTLHAGKPFSTGTFSVGLN